ncbi:MAG TPA: arylsulfatase [Spirochaetia bacterium]|nr:arylsulfatase [Spirochaetia bacterium]
MPSRPNIVLILNDDMGYSDIGCYGGEVQTPNLDRLAANGVRFTQFYNTPRCSPSRASLLTGLHPHQTSVGILTENQLPDGYEGNLNRSCATIAEVLGRNGYGTYMSGKWHVANDWFDDKSNWPLQRGFDHFYGIIAGSANYYNPITLTRDNDNIEHEALDPGYYFTDAISRNAADFIRGHRAEAAKDPFFLYVAYTSPHWPLHAPPEVTEKYSGRFAAGWDRLRRERLERMVEKGLINRSWQLSPRDATQPPWDEASNKAWEQRRMEVYAAQIDRMDQGIGKIIETLSSTGCLDDTLILFMSDNGGCAEVLLPPAQGLLSGHLAREYAKTGEKVVLGNDPNRMPGDESTYQSYGVAWANLSNTPFRLYKHWTHEGGISTPFIAHWPAGGIKKGFIQHAPAQLTSVMATVLEITGAAYPEELDGNRILPFEGESLVPLFAPAADRGGAAKRKMLYWEHEGNAAVRDGKWKLVRNYPGPWELYDMELDRTELHDLSGVETARVAEMSAAYESWAKRCGVIPRDRILTYMVRTKST